MNGSAAVNCLVASSDQNRDTGWAEIPHKIFRVTPFIEIGICRHLQSVEAVLRFDCVLSPRELLEELLSHKDCVYRVQQYPRNWYS